MILLYTWVAEPRVSMEHLLPDIVEQILIRLNVRDLIRCKSVSKSWRSLISDPRFIKSHLQHSYHRDRNNDEIGHRRIVMSRYASFYLQQQYEIDNHAFDFLECHLLGSSDGLVCVSPSRTEIQVVNPSTREVNKLNKPQIPETGSLCWGFGYDSSTDDYKVVLGFRKGENLTCFQVLSLRSNIWKVIGEVNYTFISRIGILCKGALHWVAYDTPSEKKEVILSFHLSEEKFGVVPQPDDMSYQSRVAQHLSMRLGTMEDSLCVFRHEILPYGLWVMKDYNVKQSWGIIGHEREIKYEAVHCLKRLKNYIPNMRPLCHETMLCRSVEFLGAPIFVQSLVSPHVHRRSKRKRRATNTFWSRMVKPDDWILALYVVPRANASASTNVIA